MRMRKKSPVGRTVLFDRLALTVSGFVVGYLSGLGLGFAAFMLACLVGLAKLDTASGRFFFYDLPLWISAASALGAAIAPQWTAEGLAKLWYLIVILWRFISGGPPP